jgi:hypothetical protein
MEYSDTQKLKFGIKHRKKERKKDCRQAGT